MIRVAFFIPNYPDRLSTKKPSSLSLFQRRTKTKKIKELSLSLSLSWEKNEKLKTRSSLFYRVCILASERVAKRFAVNKKDLVA